MVSSLKTGWVLLIVLGMQVSLKAQEEYCLMAEQQDGKVEKLQTGNFVKVKLLDGRKLKGTLIVREDKLALADGTEFDPEAIAMIASDKKVPDIYLGPSATAEKKSVIAGLNTAGTSVKAYMLWYVQGFFEGIPERIQLKHGIIKERYRRKKGWKFRLT